jgi:hypothetical protein
VTNQGAEPTADDELWTPGEAARYLNAGGVNLGWTPRRVTDAIKRGDLAGVQTHAQAWRRTPASGIRALRVEQLAALGRTDPDLPPAPHEQAPEVELQLGQAAPQDSAQEG